MKKEKAMLPARLFRVNVKNLKNKDTKKRQINR